ncbi:hypothetical protein L2E82_28397 [Cichorium intybus]|uniref:Uncharacterized protein n=1 Tax=Cichorium intybus TaxID=13427 RepID=A0ACB9CVI8_CICIN|nr:hypothetical protein L2E82_28397 [Cichorium intybus]
MTSNGGREEEFQLVSHVKEEYKEDVNVTAGNKPGSQQSNELQVSKVDGRNPVVVHRNIISLPPQPQQQPQGSLIHWERFLHVESIKVMLVENDDCTRHIVTALLRNCNYEVIEASNGFQAWKILEDLSNHIDIVLTEVVMPSFSGVGLLCKIMSHKTRKNIPVIMMSSHDSMGLVFKCLSKGAVDFLLKPIRKNELKNLWQHVWRRCHSSSGSGSESGTNAQKSVNSKRSDDNISIAGDDDDGGTRDGSDDGSGTQSSWTKQAETSPCDSTCGLVIHSAETPITRDFQGLDEGDVEMGKELETGGSKDSKKIGEFEVVKDSKNILDTDTKVMNESKETLAELSLKRPREVTQVQNGTNVLTHSELSAFTRYNTTSKQDVPGKSSDTPEADLVGPPQVHHIHHHHHVHHYHNIESNQPPDNHEVSGLKNLAAIAPHCGSSNVLGGGGVEGNIGNCSLNGSGSGSKHGSNGQNGSSAAVNLEGKNVESGGGGGLAGKSGGGGENRIDEDKSSQREAALKKFREKRKNRCFQKKVRYQNRKRLAEERPRVRGQFVKQTGQESSSNGEDR